MNNDESARLKAVRVLDMAKANKRRLFANICFMEIRKVFSSIREKVFTLMLGAGLGSDIESMAAENGPKTMRSTRHSSFRRRKRYPVSA